MTGLIFAAGVAVGALCALLSVGRDDHDPIDALINATREQR